nr:MAG TPA: hypothetical protein [Caudoviricetes sp.]
MRRLWASTFQYPSDDKNNPAEAGFYSIHNPFK